MSAFDQLHPALQHHIVNSLGWRELRPFQEEVIPPILAGDHLIVLAPTAGGKTEAAFFPVASRMLSEGWTGLSVLYICPIKALLNNLDARLQRYCTLLGRRSALWHGDVPASSRKQVQREPPDCLLTTPESLEVMLVSTNVDARGLFANVRAVIVDEIHAFAGDDRGWHLLSVLERVARMAGRELQRIGLSATVGNPELLVEWLAGNCQGNRRAYLPPATTQAEADVTLDYVGSLANAATVISRLHRGEKRLVFIDSRARAEQLAAELRGLDVTTFVTHSSLSTQQRHETEAAFAARENCVIVATSVLELGIDVGDLDRVIQIDSPPTVASFLQRMGRSGRRAGTRRNCLFLATGEDLLIQAAGLIDLWSQGYVEPVVPPVEPYHILAQQLMALALQEGGIGRRDWFGWIQRVSAFQQMAPEPIRRVLDFMVERQILWDDQGILALGRQGEATYGRKNFMELFSVFTSPPLFAVRHGRQDLGFVDESSFLARQEGPRVLLLGGRAWQVNHVDWRRRIAFVEASQSPGRSRWKGSGRLLSHALCQAVMRLLAEDAPRECWSQRSRDKISQVRAEFPWLDPETTALLIASDGSAQWRTFAGTKANAVLAHELAQELRVRVDHDAYLLTLEGNLPAGQIDEGVQRLRRRELATFRAAIDDRALEGLKFSECLPDELARRLLASRMADTSAVAATLARQVRVITAEA